MTWENRLELNHAIGIRLLDTPQERGVEVGSVISVTVSVCDQAGVDASGVAVPDVPPEIGDRFAGCYVHELPIEDDGDSGLGFANVGANVLAQNIVLGAGQYRLRL